MAETNIPPIVAVFSSWPAAAAAIDDLIAAGFSADRVGYVTRKDEIATPNESSADASELAAIGTGEQTDVAAGMLAGGMVGGVLAAGLSLLIPGIGPILAGGVLASFFGGTLAGTAVGGLLGALTNLGISQDMAERYQDEIHAGRVIVAVSAGSRAADATEILARHGGTHIHSEADPGELAHPTLQT